MGENLKPFLDGERIRHSGRFSELYEITDNPNYVAKVVDLDHSSPLDYNQRIEKFNTDVKRLKEYFGDFIPEFHVIRGESSDGYNKSTGTPHIFMKKVFPIENFTFVDAQNYLDSLDIDRRANYMYGKVENNNEPKLYFVDLYPIFKTSPEGITTEAQTLIRKINHSLDLTLQSVKVNGKDYDFDNSKKLTHEFTKTTSALEKVRELIKEQPNVNKKP